MLKVIFGIWGAYALVAIAALVGWVMNIIQLFGMTADFSNVKFLFKLVGVVFPPLGAVLGYL